MEEAGCSIEEVLPLHIPSPQWNPLPRIRPLASQNVIKLQLTFNGPLKEWNIEYFIVIVSHKESTSVISLIGWFDSNQTDKPKSFL